MTTYAFKGRGAALPYEAPFMGVLTRKVDLPDLIANPEKLANASAPTVGLTSFSGFVQDDILELFEVPAGTKIVGCGTYVSTAEGATAAAEIGFNSATQTLLGVAGSAADPDAYMNTVDLNTTGYEDESLLGVEDAPDNVISDLYVTDGSIDIKFTTDDTYAAAIFWVWAEVKMTIPS